MTSPFDEFANATITFKITGTSIAVDSSGYPAYPVSDLVALVHLKAKKSTFESRQGADKFSSEVKGYWVLPSSKPVVPPNTRGRIVVGTATGTFTLTPTVPNPFIESLEIEGMDELSGVILWD